MSAPLPALPPPRRSRGESMTVGQALERAEELRPGCKVDSCTRQQARYNSILAELSAWLRRRAKPKRGAQWRW